MAILDIVLKSTLLIALGAAIVVLYQRSAASHRHLVWMLVMGGLLALPALMKVVPPMHVLPILEEPVRQRNRGDMPAPAFHAPSQRLAPINTVTAVQRSNFDARGLLRYWWVLGVAIALLRFGLARMALFRLVRRSRRVTDDAWWLALDDAATRLGVTTPVRLLESDDARMPMTFGVRRAVIVLPSEYTAWTDEQRDVVLLHELAHIRRGDARTNLLSQLVCSFYWFHPAVWVAAKRLRIEAERACDDMVLHAGAAPSAYAAQLLAMVQSVLTMRAPALALPLAQRSAFEGRVLAILEPGMKRKQLSPAAVAAGTIMMMCVAVPLAALAPMQRMATPTPTPAPTPGIAMPTPTPTPTPRPTPRVVLTARDRERIRTEVREHMVTRDRQPQGNPTVRAAFIEALADADEGVRDAAAHALGEMGDSSAVDALLNALRRDASKQVRTTAAWALGQIEDRRAVSGLIAALHDEREVEVRRQVVWALGQIESEDAVPGLGAAIRSETDLDTKRMAIWALGQIESRSAVPFLVPLLRDSDTESREKTAWALGQIESADAIDGIAAAYAAERENSVKEQLLWALGQIEDARAVPTLVTALRDTSVEVRKKALWALGQIDGGGAEVAQALINAMKDSDPEIRRLAARALGNR